MDKSSLVMFLKDLCLSLENDSLQPKQLKSVQAFHGFYQMTNENMLTECETLDEKDFLKLLLICTFVYNLSTVIKTT